MAALLPAAEQQLFARMPVFDQRHCLDVCQTLERGGYTDPMLLRAALIHDIGKIDDQGQPIPLAYYGLFVVLRKLAPWLYQRAAADGRGLLRPFAVHATHEQRSAESAATAGCSPELVAVLRDYAAKQPTWAAQALAWADDSN